MGDVTTKAINATKWSFLAEFTAKLIQPLSTMALARLLTPEAFGVMVTATLVISFTELFTDAGFNKYLVQRNFKTEKELLDSMSVAFWSNMTISIISWLIIVLYSSDIAEYVGSKGYGNCIAVAATCIPLAAFSTIQIAMYNRALDFKTLYFIRLIGIAIPILVTIPIAWVTRSYWSLIIGLLGQQIANALVLLYKSKWKIRLYYKWTIFKQMFSFSFWSMIESLINWLTKYIDLFIVGKLLSDYYLGIYKTSMGTVAQITSLVTAATTAVLFSTLSRFQNNNEEIRESFIKFIKVISLLILPMGMIIFLFRDIIVWILLGDQWKEADYFVGIWGLRDAITIVFTHYTLVIFRAKGKPILTVLAQGSYVLCIVPVILWAIPKGFDILCTARALASIELVLVCILIAWIYIKLSFLKILKVISIPLFGVFAMILCHNIIPQSDNLYLRFISLSACIGIYTIIIMCFPQSRNTVFKLKSYLINRTK